VTAADDYSDLHELIDCSEPDQADELREHALRLVRPASSRFKYCGFSMVLALI